MNQLRIGALLNYVAIIVNILIGLIYTPYMLRMLGQSEFGLYSLAASIIAYLTILDLGFGNAIVRYTSKFRAEGKVEEQQYMFGMFLLLYLVVGIVAFIAGAILTMNVQTLFSQNMTVEEVERTRIMLWLMTLNLCFTFPMSIWSSIMSAYERFVFQRIVTIFRSILNPLVMVVLLSIGYKAIAMVVVMTIFNVVTLIINYLYCRVHLKIVVKFGRFNWDFLKEVSIYSFWIFLNVIMDRIYWSTGQFVLGVFKGTAAIAVYAVAIQLQSMYMMFSTAISGVFLPRLTAMVVKENNEKAISDIFIRTGRMQYIVMAFILTGFILFGYPFILLWAGEDYGEAYYISLLFFVPLTIPLIQNIGICILQARNQMRFRSLLYLVIALFSLGISIPLAKLYGGVGCAWGTSIALILGQVIVMNIYYHKKQHLNMIVFWSEILKMSIVPLFFIILFMAFGEPFIVLLSSPVNLVVGILLFILSYVPLFWFFSMNTSERNLVSSPFRRFINR